MWLEHSSNFSVENWKRTDVACRVENTLFQLVLSDLTVGDGVQLELVTNFKRNRNKHRAAVYSTIY